MCQLQSTTSEPINNLKAIVVLGLVRFVRRSVQPLSRKLLFGQHFFTQKLNSALLRKKLPPFEEKKNSLPSRKKFTPNWENVLHIQISKKQRKTTQIHCNTFYLHNISLYLTKASYSWHLFLVFIHILTHILQLSRKIIVSICLYIWYISIYMIL